jgi:hypothetical protein
MAEAVDAAKRVLTSNEKVLYGIFGLIGGSGYFPPHEFLNEFLMLGSDPCDQDARMGHWQTFALSSDEYEEVKMWWISGHPGTMVSHLGVGCWNDWIQTILNPEDWGFPEGLPHSVEQ